LTPPFACATAARLITEALSEGGDPDEVIKRALGVLDRVSAAVPA
jgi:hypothetical protein